MIPTMMPATRWERINIDQITLPPGISICPSRPCLSFMPAGTLSVCILARDVQISAA
jgi:hypothetical protein